MNVPVPQADTMVTIRQTYKLDHLYKQYIFNMDAFYEQNVNRQN